MAPGKTDKKTLAPFGHPDPIILTYGSFRPYDNLWKLLCLINESVVLGLSGRL